MNKQKTRLFSLLEIERLFSNDNSGIFSHKIVGLGNEVGSLPYFTCKEKWKLFKTVISKNFKLKKTGGNAKCNKLSKGMQHRRYKLLLETLSLI